MFDDFGIMVIYKTNILLKLYWGIRKIKVRVPKNPKHILKSLTIQRKNITLKAEELLKHPPAKLCAYKISV